MTHEITFCSAKRKKTDKYSRVLEVLQHIKRQGATTVSELSAELRISKRSVQRHIARLESYDLVSCESGHEVGDNNRPVRTITFCSGRGV